MARTRQEMSQETIAKLIASAREQFSRLGYAQTSMDELCARVGLTRGALYHHFGSKKGLLEAVVRELDGEVLAVLDEVYGAEADPWEAFRVGCVAYLELALRPDIQQVYLRDAAAVLGQRMREIDAESSLVPMVGVLEELMDQERIVRTEPEALARLLSGAMVDAALWIASSPSPETTLHRAREGLLALLDGLALR